MSFGKFEQISALRIDDHSAALVSKKKRGEKKFCTNKLQVTTHPSLPLSVLVIVSVFVFVFVSICISDRNTGTDADTNRYANKGINTDKKIHNQG